MRIGLISDTHGDPMAWELSLKTVGDIDLLVHSGDVLYHGIFNPIKQTYDPRRLADLLNSCEVPVVHARGNCDSEVDQLALKNHILSDFAFIHFDCLRILVTHGHKHGGEELNEMAARGGFRLLVRGHTHIPEIKEARGVLVVNPGSCSLPKQEGRFPTVGLVEGDLVRILNAENGETYLEERIPG